MTTNQMEFEEPREENNDLQDFDELEALSLCDLPLNNKASNLDDDDYCCSSTKEDQCSSFDQDFFEFFSEDFTASTTCNYNPKDHIMFCGKIISHKEQETPIKAKDSMTKQKEIKRSPLFSWSRSSNKWRTTSMITRPEKGFDQEGKNLSAKHKRTRSDSDFQMKKMPVLASSRKSRWYLLGFGVGRYPMEMELSDMKTRQSKMMEARRSSPHHGNSEKAKSVGSGTKSIWRILNFLGYRNQQANLVVTASFGCLPIM